MVANLKHKGRKLEFTEEDKLSSWANYVVDEETGIPLDDILRDQAVRLTNNLLEKKTELLRNVIRKHLGHLPSSKKAAKYMHLHKNLDQPGVVWVYWRKICLAVYTEPTSHIEEGTRKYTLTWHWKDLV